MPSLPNISRKKYPNSRKLWFERVMAFIALTNLGLVLFDLSYVPWRNFWLQGNVNILDFSINIPLPPIAKWYDPVKGIEPNRDTEKYLEKVQELQEQVAQTGLSSPQVENLLSELRGRSTDMIDTNPFEVANKTGTLEKIKNRMRKHIGNESAKESFRIFWSQPHFTQPGWSPEIGYFKSEIQPLIETNYFRPVGENGEPVDFFFKKIDWIFFIIFAVEFAGRVIYISRTHKGVSWRDAILWRWYDIFLLLPFWRWLRVIPVIIRLKHARIGNIDKLQQEFNHGFVATFAQEITEVVVVGVIDQVQGAIKNREVSRWLLQPENRPYIDINNVDEVAEISNIITKLAVYQIFPKIQPDIEALLRHNIESVLQKLPAYRSFQSIPGLANIPNQLTERLVKEISQAVYEGLTSAVEDPVGAKLSGNLIQHLQEAFVQELQNQKTLDKVQSLLLDMLEEIKINYVERLSQEDMEQIVEETRQLRQMANPQDVKITPYRQA